MVRMTILFLLALTMTAAAQVIGALPTAPPMLKPAATVFGDIVRIGDLIENAGAAAEVPIFRAPDLGTSGLVPARRVLEAVRMHQLVGLETNGIVEVAVTRASRAIGAKE